MHTFSLTFLMAVVACDDGYIDTTCEDTESACGNSTVTEDTASEQLSVEAIIPAYSPDIGGVQIRMEVSGLSVEPAVYFGSDRATVVEFDDTSITVEAPPFSPPPADFVVVDVRVEVDGDTVELSDAFTYYGQQAVPQQLELALVHSVDSLIASLSHYSQTYPGFLSFLPDEDSCVGSADQSYNEFFIDAPSDTVVALGSPSSDDQFTIWPNDGATELPLGDTENDLRVDVIMGPNIEHQLSDHIQAVESLTMVTPPAGITDEISPNEVFTWETIGGDTESTLVLISGSQASGGSIFCHVQDDGFFRMDLTAWEDFQVGQPTIVALSRVHTEALSLPWGDADFTVMTLSTASIEGTAVLPG
ncbi:MAG: IPT/TIG domain-containing protein [Myxococcota bacterium]